MPICINITDPRDPRLSDYFDLNDPAVREQEFAGHRPCFICEGELVVRALIESGHTLRSILCTPAKAQSLADLFARLPADTPIFILPRPLIEGVTGFDFHRGVIASGARSNDHAADLARLVRDSRALILLEEVSNCDNIGAVFRNAACLGGPGVSLLLTPGCCDPLYRKSIRVSMGHALKTPHAAIPSIAQALPLLKEAGFATLAFTPAPSAIDLEEAAINRKPGQRLALLFGSEGDGLSPQSLAAADLKVRIPMAPGTDSINIATSCAIALYRLTTQYDANFLTPEGK